MPIPMTTTTGGGRVPYFGFGNPIKLLEVFMGWYEQNMYQAYETIWRIEQIWNRRGLWGGGIAGVWYLAMNIYDVWCVGSYVLDGEECARWEFSVRWDRQHWIEGHKMFGGVFRGVWTFLYDWWLFWWGMTGFFLISHVIWGVTWCVLNQVWIWPLPLGYPKLVLMRPAYGP